MSNMTQEQYPTITDNTAFGDVLSKFLDAEIEREKHEEGTPQHEILVSLSNRQFHSLVSVIDAWVVFCIHAAHFGLAGDSPAPPSD